jgi:hypothetical protein
MQDLTAANGKAWEEQSDTVGAEKRYKKMKKSLDKSLLSA